MDITNKTPKPLSVPLPGGKKLFLGPGKTGQVTAKAMEHKPLLKLIESGELEASDGGPPPIGGDSPKKGTFSGSSRHQGGGGPMRQSGDR